eukprot:m.412840 g.412840  ORF g.412840 m.412840 type:complete len:333 (-) comp28952_c0_seq1:136-1134(-)
MSRAISNAEFFANVAILSGRRSDDPTEHLGACLVTAEGAIAAVGHATLAPGFSWSTVLPSERPHAVCPAEINAVIAAGNNAKGCAAYLVKFPTAEGAKVLIAAGISTIICLQQSTPRADLELVTRMLNGAEIRCDTLPLKVPQPVPMDGQSTPSAAPAAASSVSAPPSAVPAPSAGAPPPAFAGTSAAEPVTPQKPRDPASTEFFAVDGMSLQDVAKAVVSGNDGDYLIRLNEKHERVLIVKDSEAKDKIRMYTMKPDGAGKWIFGNHKFGSMKSVVQLLQTKPIKSKTGKMIRLGAPAPGGISRDEPEPSQPGTPAAASGEAAEEDGCAIM